MPEENRLKGRTAETVSFLRAILLGRQGKPAELSREMNSVERYKKLAEFLRVDKIRFYGLNQPFFFGLK